MLPSSLKSLDLMGILHVPSAKGKLSGDYREQTCCNVPLYSTTFSFVRHAVLFLEHCN